MRLISSVSWSKSNWLCRDANPLRNFEFVYGKLTSHTCWCIPCPVVRRCFSLGSDSCGPRQNAWTSAALRPSWRYICRTWTRSGRGCASGVTSLPPWPTTWGSSRIWPCSEGLFLDTWLRDNVMRCHWFSWRTHEFFFQVSEVVSFICH